MLTFDAAKHEYRVNGIIVPSVTGVISAVLGDRYPETEAVERAKDRGTEVHRTIALDLAGNLDEASVDPQVAPYLAAARLFLRESGIVAEYVEKRLYSDRYKVAGTVDFIGAETIVEWKSGAKDAAHAIQTMAYQMLAEEAGIKIKSRMAGYLSGEGQYKLEMHKAASDRQDFLAILQVFRLKERIAR